MKDIFKHPSSKAHTCLPMPDFERINYYYGQALGVADFQTEQNYFLEKLRLHNRCFHGYGIVCGLEVTPLPHDKDCDSEGMRKRREIETAIAAIDKQIKNISETTKQQASDIDQLRAEKEELLRCLEKIPDCYPKDAPVPAEVCVKCGWAMDCEGREIIVRQSHRIDLWSLLSAEQLCQVKEACDKGNTEITVELNLCYCEQPTYPSRPVLTDTCAAVSKCVYGRTLEGFKFRVSLPPNNPDNRCSNCCEPCENQCVVLAYIHWNPNRPITWEDIDWRPRRNVSVYQPTVITGISWLHGANYTSDQAKDVLGTERSNGTRKDGIEVKFSKPIYAETLQSGVVDILCFRGGRGLSGAITLIEGSFVDKPETGLIDYFKYRDDSGENLDPGDRILIVIRGNFILDACCQPVDAEHVGGLVPQLDAYRNNGIVTKSLYQTPDCATARHQPWTSGNGRPGATFESWFFIN